MPKAGDTPTNYPDLFLAIEPIIHELRSGARVLAHVGASNNEVEREEILFVADKLEEAIERLQAAWDAEDNRRVAAEATRLLVERPRGSET